MIFHLIVFCSQFIAVVLVIFLEIQEIGESFVKLKVWTPILQLLNISAKRKANNHTSRIREYLGQRVVEFFDSAQSNHVDNEGVGVRRQLENGTAFFFFLVIRIDHAAAPFAVRADDWLTHQLLEQGNVIHCLNPKNPDFRWHL